MLLNFARAAKLVALFGFFLPWVSVSCAGTEALSATGLQLMTGDATLNPALAALSQGDAQMREADPALPALLAFAALLIGLGLSWWPNARAAAAAVAAAGALAAGLSMLQIQQLQNRLQDVAADLPDGRLRDQLGGAAASVLRVEGHEGFYATLFASGTAGAIGLIALFGPLPQRPAGARPGPRPDQREDPPT